MDIPSFLLRNNNQKLRPSVQAEYNRQLFVFECNNAVLYAQLVARLLIQLEVL